MDTTVKTGREGGGGAAAELAAVREELTRLAARVATLEAALAARAPAAGAGGAVPLPAPPAAPAARAEPRPAGAEGLPEELLLVLSAAIAAFLGKKARIRQIRLAESFTWMYAGRVNIQGSHAIVHGRGGGAP